MKAIVNGAVVADKQVVYMKALLFDEKIIGFADAEELPSDIEKIDAEGGYVIPGLIDLHIHGYAGEDVSDGSVDGIKKMALEIAKNGVTAWCPTTMTVSKEQIEKSFCAVREAKKLCESGVWDGAQVLGVNSEGPFINPVKKGAQAEENILPPDSDFIIKNKDIVRLVTMAPEMDNNYENICRIKKETNVVVSIGHSDADCKTAKEAIKNGASHITHLFNAMTAFTHRAPGIVGAALTDESVSCELIADTFHVSADLFELLAGIKGSKLVLISDCMRAGGMSDGEYTLGGQKVIVNGRECRLENGVIAGSVLKLNEALENFRENTNLPIWKIVRAATLNPATVIGEDNVRGSITPGKRADIVITTKKFDVKKTIIGGRVCYEQ